MSDQPIIMTCRSARREGAEAMSLLDAIMDGLCDEGSGSMRELSAKLLAEFMKWSAKHVPDDAGKHTAITNCTDAGLNRTS